MVDKKLIQLVADPYFPFQYVEDGEIRGIDHDVIQAAFREHGIETHTRLFAWDECIRIMEAALADGLFQIQPTAARARTFHFSTLLRTARTVFLENSSIPIDLSNMQTEAAVLEKYSLGTVSGYSYGSAIDGLSGPNRVFVVDQEALLIGLAQGNFDLALMDWEVAVFLCRKLGIEGVDKVAGFEYQRQLHVAFQKELGKIVNLFNSGIDKLEKEGGRRRIYEKYDFNS
jgi:polar amino acid transport system substrate-binding protein